MQCLIYVSNSPFEISKVWAILLFQRAWYIRKNANKRQEAVRGRQTQGSHRWRGGLQWTHRLPYIKPEPLCVLGTSSEIKYDCDNDFSVVQVFVHPQIKTILLVFLLLRIELLSVRALRKWTCIFCHDPGCLGSWSNTTQYCGHCGNGIWSIVCDVNQMWSVPLEQTQLSFCFKQQQVIDSHRQNR